MLKNPIKKLLVAVLVIWCAPQARADWTRFRGPNGSGICDDNATMPVRWTSTANLQWKTKLPGPGVSSPIVVGDRVYVTCYSGYGLDRRSPGDQENLRRHLVSIDRQTGKTIWDRVVDPVLPEDPYSGIGVPAHGYASNTPVSDGENIYVFFGKTGVLAFDREGQQLWQTSVGKESDPRHWGSAASPILYNNLLIVPAIAESEALVALDRKSGKEVWRQEASGFANSWSTPVLVGVDDARTDLVIGVTQEIWGLNPDTGKLRWYSQGAGGRSFCSSPVSNGQVAYAIEGQSGFAIAVRTGGKGDVSKSHVVWTGREAARFASPIVHEGRIYSFGNGVVTVLNAASGERLSRFRMQGGTRASRGGDYASPILADGKLYMVHRSGETHVLRAGKTLETLAVNRLTDDNEDFSATPAAGDGNLYIRSDKHLYCVAAMGQDVPDSLVASAGLTAVEAESDDNGPGRNFGARPGGNRGSGGRGRGGFDTSARFKQHDGNGDGKLTADELPERMRGRMAQMDTDKDGSLTPDEFRNGLAAMFVAPAGNRRPAGRTGRSGRNGRSGRTGRRGNRASSRGDKPDRPQRPELEP
ncbi:MAG: PQQ-binding-like beta-propeller repeat protein [Phycisphaerae bacterium]